MSGQHTPGPWEVIRHDHINGELWLSVNQHADATGMKEWVAEIKYLTSDEARQWANAHLIAAAPELLDMLKFLDSKGGLGLDVHAMIARVLAKVDGKDHS